MTEANVTFSDSMNTRNEDRTSSVQVDKATVVELDTSNTSNARFSLGVVMYEADGTTQVAAATGGTFTIKYKTWNSLTWETWPDSAEISAAAPETFTVAGDVVAVQVTPASVAGNDVDRYEVRVSAHRS